MTGNIQGFVWFMVHTFREHRTLHAFPKYYNGLRYDHPTAALCFILLRSAIISQVAAWSFAPLVRNYLHVEVRTTGAAVRWS